MRAALIVWCAIGAALIGVKAHLDRTGSKYSDLAVRAGARTYFIPRAVIAGGDGWRTDLMRFAGCWDAREAGLVQAAAPVADCDRPRLVRLQLPPIAVGDADDTGQRKPLDVDFWTAYAPPREHVVQLVQAWDGRGEWARRQIVSRDDWRLIQIVSPNSPWVFLLAAKPQHGTAFELASLYAGRCYRPETLSDAGMTCAIALRFEGNVAVEYSLGPDEIRDFVPVRSVLQTQVEAWANP